MTFEEAFSRFCSNWQNQVDISIDRNLQGFAADANFMGEALGSFITGKKGPDHVSGGMGFDLSNGLIGDECKLACLIQPKECLSCGKRFMYFNNKCSCGSTNYKYVDDSRFTISAKDAVIYRDKIEYYILQVLKRGETDNEIIYEAFLVESKNEQFVEYTENQHFNSSSKYCNLLPYSYDFYRCSPFKVARVKCNIGGEFNIEYYDPLNRIPEKLDPSVLKKKELELYGPHIDPSQLPLRSKNLNKNRGTTTRQL